ncbi:MAG: EamA family transporter [Ignavibacteria bacterium]|nr:EamA family transporter [Ignavibacteria bacterium]
MPRKFSATNQMQSWILLLILSIIWGSSFILIKRGLVYFTPLQVGTLRITFAFLVMLPFALKRIKKVSGDKWKFFAFTGLISNLVPAVLFALAQTKLESSLTGILNALSPLFTLIFAVLMFKFKPNSFQIGGFVLGMAGTVGLSLVNSSGGIGNMNVYVWLIVLATICYALSLNFIKYFLSDVNSLTITSLSLLIAGPFSIIILLSTDFLGRLNFSSEIVFAISCIAVLGILGTAIALVLYTKLIHMNSPLFASSVTYLVPVVAIMWGVWDGEVLFPLHFAGMVLILLGIYFINKSG